MHIDDAARLLGLSDRNSIHQRLRRPTYFVPPEERYENRDGETYLTEVSMRRLGIDPGAIPSSEPAPAAEIDPAPTPIKADGAVFTPPPDPSTPLAPVPAWIEQASAPRSPVSNQVTRLQQEFDAFRREHHETRGRYEEWMRDIHGTMTERAEESVQIDEFMRSSKAFFGQAVETIAEIDERLERIEEAQRRSLVGTFVRAIIARITLAPRPQQRLYTSNRARGYTLTKRRQ